MDAPAPSSSSRPFSQWTEDEQLQEATRRLNAKFAARKAQATQTEQPPEPVEEPVPEEKSLLSRGKEAWDSIGVGMLKAGFETSDFVMGQPEEADKSDIRRDVEARGKQLSESSTVNSVTMGISQIATGLVGAGKILGPIKAVQKLKGAGVAGRAAYEIGIGAAAGSVVIDPHEERLSDLVEEFPSLSNPVTQYLQADPDDSSAEGRFKNAIESVGLDLTLLGVIKTIKYLRAGNTKAAQVEIAKLEAKEYAAVAPSRRDFLKGSSGPELKAAEGQVVSPVAGAEVQAVDEAVAPTPAAASPEAQAFTPPEVPAAVGPEAQAVTPEAAPAAAAGTPEVPAANSSAAAGKFLGGMGSGIGDSYREALWVKAQGGETKEAAGNVSAILQAAKMARSKGGLQTREEFVRFVDEFDAADNDVLRAGPKVERQKVLKGIVAKYSTGQVVDPNAVPAAAAPEVPAAKAPELEAVPEGAIKQEGLQEPIGANGARATARELDAPGVVRTKEVTDEDLATILKSSKDDMAAVSKHGGRGAAMDAGHVFGRQVRLPWQKLRGTQETMAFIRRAAQTLSPRFAAAKGGEVMGDAKVRSLVKELATTFNAEPALIMGQLAEAGDAAKDMVSFMEAGLRIGNKMFEETNELASQVRLGNLDAFSGNLNAAHAELKARLAATIDVMAASNSILANAGRTMRRARSKFRIKDGDLAALKGLDGDKLAIIMEKADGDASKIMLLANRTWSQRVMDESIFHLTNGLLWMWPTHLVNTTTNAFMLVARPTEKLFGSAALRLITNDPGKRAELSTVTRQAMREYLNTVTAMGDGWTSAVEAFKRGDSILSPHNTEYFQKGTTGVATGQIQWKPIKGVVDLVQNILMAASYRNIVGLPTRALGASDEFFKTLRYRAVVQSRAAMEVADQGLNGQAAKDYIQRALDQTIDPASGQALDPKAIRESQMATFQQDLDYEVTFGGSVGMSLTNMRRTAPVLGWVLPFIKTPVNVIRYGIKMTPGLNLAQKEFRDAFRGLAGPEAQAHAIGQMAMGSLFAGLAAHLVTQGRFTGGGPDDTNLRQELLASGWRPYSYVYEDDEGNTKYFQAGRFDPATTVMGLVADVVEIMQRDEERDPTALIQAVVVAVAKNLGEKAFLQNIDAALKALMEPEKHLDRWAGRTASSMLPASSLMRGMNPDPYLREARTFLDQFKSGIPGLSKTLPKRFTVFGEPIERTVGVIGNQKPDILEAEHNRIMLQTGKGLGKVNPKLDEVVDLRDLKLEKDGSNAYERLQEYSGQIPGQKSLRAVLAKLIKSKAYQTYPDGDAGVVGTRLNALSSTREQYHQAAKAYFLRQNPELRPLMQSHQKAARGAIIENRNQRKQGQPGARDLLEALRPQ